MKTTTWAALGSLFINVMLGLVIAAMFSATPSAQAGEPAHQSCAGQANHTKQAPPQATPAPTRRAYLVEVRMGWGPAG